MSKDNVFPLRPAQKQASDTTIKAIWDYAVAMMKADAALIDAEKLLSMKPLPDHVAQQLEQLEQVGLEAYTDCNGNRCYRPLGDGERQRQANRQREWRERQAHLEHVRREVEALRLDEIDPDWRDHFPTQDTAARYYWREIGEYISDGESPPKRTLGDTR